MCLCDYKLCVCVCDFFSVVPAKCVQQVAFVQVVRLSFLVFFIYNFNRNEKLETALQSLAKQASRSHRVDRCVREKNETKFTGLQWCAFASNYTLGRLRNRCERKGKRATTGYTSSKTVFSCCSSILYAIDQRSISGEQPSSQRTSRFLQRFVPGQNTAYRVSSCEGSIGTLPVFRDQLRSGR